MPKGASSGYRNQFRAGLYASGTDEYQPTPAVQISFPLLSQLPRAAVEMNREQSKGPVETLVIDLAVRPLQK
jgi:hypothetical protein